jgi:imidazoleglycerol phosphate dehydratase HisB
MKGTVHFLTHMCHCCSTFKRVDLSISLKNVQVYDKGHS